MYTYVYISGAIHIAPVYQTRGSIEWTFICGRHGMSTNVLKIPSHKLIIYQFVNKHMVRNHATYQLMILHDVQNFQKPWYTSENILPYPNSYL